MVVFTCNNCGDSLQKPKVAKHYQFQCKNSPSLTCVDCFKDFYGDEYVAHTKCITEAERYGGKDYKAKPSANKGERKQQEWIDVVQNVLTNSANLSKDERSFLHSISRHQNIPRKKAKFLNFVKNAVGYRLNMTVVESCWTKMENASKTSSDKPEDKPEPKASEPAEEAEAPMEVQETHVAENENNENICRENGSADLANGKEKKKSKKRKAETDSSGQNEEVELKGKDTEDLTNGKGKKSKKRKTETESSEDQSKSELKEEAAEDLANGKEKKKSKKRKVENGQNEKAETVEETESSGAAVDKFCWKSTIIGALGDRDEVPLKKVRKNTVARYLEHAGEGMTREKAISRFEKKLKKVSEVLVVEDKVKRVM